MSAGWFKWMQVDAKGSPQKKLFPVSKKLWGFETLWTSTLRNSSQLRPMFAIGEWPSSSFRPIAKELQKAKGSRQVPYSTPSEHRENARCSIPPLANGSNNMLEQYANKREVQDWKGLGWLKSGRTFLIPFSGSTDSVEPLLGSGLRNWSLTTG